jgi:hypothetical protein
LLRALLRFVAAALLVGSVAAAFQGELVAAAMPPFRIWLGWIDSTYRTIDLSVANANGELVVRRLATPAHPHAVGGEVVDGDPSQPIATQAAAGLVLQPLVLALALVVAWPWRSAAELAVRVTVAAPLALLIALLDVPLMLYGVAWNSELALLDPSAFSPLVYWADFMNAGGRFALTVAAVAVSVWASSAVARNVRAGLPVERRTSLRLPTAPAQHEAQHRQAAGE